LSAPRRSYLAIGSIARSRRQPPPLPAGGEMTLPVAPGSSSPPDGRSVAGPPIHQETDRSEIKPPAMSNTPAMRVGVQLSLNSTTPNRKARMDSSPSTTM
jgi:hypothetical protein